MNKLLKRWLEAMDGNNRTCACCGRCCEAFGGHLHAYGPDIKRWKKEGREDLLQRVNRLGWIWVEPETKEPLDRCPFIQIIEPGCSFCLINDTKSQMCRDYPPIENGRRYIHENKKEKE